MRHSVSRRACARNVGCPVLRGRGNTEASKALLARGRHGLHGPFRRRVFRLATGPRARYAWTIEQQTPDDRGLSRLLNHFLTAAIGLPLRDRVGLVSAYGHFVGVHVPAHHHHVSCLCGSFDPARPAQSPRQDRACRSGRPLAVKHLWLVPTLCAGLAACPAFANSAAAQACDPLTNVHCHPHSHHPRPAAGPGRLLPVREYLKATDIPPSGVGGYGILAFTPKTTSATRAKLLMVCRSFVAHFPSNGSIPPTSPLPDRMITVWPLDDPKAEKPAAEDCDYLVDHYDLSAGESAIADAARQRVNLKGEGPFLIGWSPSNTQGAPDTLVLVVDMSADADQERIDRDFAFWEDKIVGDSPLWVRHQ